jgi:uncharacterized membrane protein YeaQ/YmgE (transglycosylase-associated protein family)
VIASMPILAVVLNPGGIISWLVIGLVAGALADWIIPGKGFGCIGNMVIGLIGAFVGGFLVSLVVSPYETYGFWGSLVVALIGACLLFIVIGMVRRR